MFMNELPFTASPLKQSVWRTNACLIGRRDQQQPVDMLQRQEC